MRRLTSLRFLVLGIGFVLLVGVGVDRGSQIDPVSLPSPHNRVGVFLSDYAVTKPGILDRAVAEARQGKLNALVINVKNEHGEVSYETLVPLARAIGASTRRLDLRTLVPGLKAQGLYLIARQVVFLDPKLAARLNREGPWVLPSDSEAVEYNLAIAEEVASFGFDEIQFDYLRFPDGDGLLPVYEERYAVVNHFLAQAKDLLLDRVAVSVDVFGRVLWDWNKKRIDPIGQSLEDIAGYVDFVSPMVYPSHYREQHYRDDPYLVVSAALASGKARISTPLRPFLQAFDMAIPAGMTLERYIQAQVQAAKDAKADGYLFWHPASEYDALYKALE